jgi:hypothetical protein
MPVTRFFVLLLSLTLTGCASQFPSVNTKLQASEAEFDVPPKELVQRIKTALAEPPTQLGVDEENKGSILTGWQSFPGEIHVARRWQERTRYRIQVIPDFDEPTKRAKITVREATETRAADGMKWEPAAELQRPQRAADLLRQLQAKLGNGPTTR